VKLQGVRTGLAMLPPSPPLLQPSPPSVGFPAQLLRCKPFGAVRRFLESLTVIGAFVCFQISARRPNTLPNIAKRHKNVSRIYGGHLSHGIVKERYVDILASAVVANIVSTVGCICFLTECLRARPAEAMWTSQSAVLSRIIRAFLIEEQKIVKRVLKAQTKKAAE